jgi:hypothetical protein
MMEGIGSEMEKSKSCSGSLVSRDRTRTPGAEHHIQLHAPGECVLSVYPPGYQPRPRNQTITHNNLSPTSTIIFPPLISIHGHLSQPHMPCTFACLRRTNSPTAPSSSALFLPPSPQGIYHVRRGFPLGVLGLLR